MIPSDLEERCFLIRPAPQAQIEAEGPNPIRLAVRSGDEPRPSRHGHQRQHRVVAFSAAKSGKYEVVSTGRIEPDPMTVKVDMRGPPGAALGMAARQQGMEFGNVPRHRSKRAPAEEIRVRQLPFRIGRMAEAATTIRLPASSTALTQAIRPPA